MLHQGSALFMDWSDKMCRRRGWKGLHLINAPSHQFHDKTWCTNHGLIEGNAEVYADPFLSISLRQGALFMDWMNKMLRGTFHHIRHYMMHGALLMEWLHEMRQVVPVHFRSFDKAWCTVNGLIKGNAGNVGHISATTCVAPKSIMKYSWSGWIKCWRGSHSITSVLWWGFVH